MPFSYRIKKIFTAIALIFSLSGCTQSAPPPKPNDSAIQIEKLTDSGHRLAAQGDKKAALGYHKRALEHSKSARLPEHEARSLLNIARILKAEDTTKSLQYLYAALGIAKRIDHKELQSDIYLALSETYRQQENYSEALHALEEHHRLLDSLFARNKSQEIARILASDRATEERKLWIAILAFIVLTAVVLAIYSRRVKKLNTALTGSNLVKDKLFSILAHDLRSPAGNIMQGLELVSTGALSKEDHEKFMTQLVRQSRSLSGTLNTLLEWAGGQLQGITSHPSAFDAKKTIHKNIEVLAGQATAKEVHIEDTTQDHLPVFADEHQFDIILRNLLSNAVKFSHKGGTIQIGATEQGNRFVFSIHDEGIGISPVRQKQLNTAGIDVSFGTQGEKGTGLGLLLVKEFAVALGGAISLASEEGKGTTFYFSVQKGDPDAV